MKNVIEMGRNELIEELRKYLHADEYKQVVRGSTAQLRSELVYYLSPLRERKDNVSMREFDWTKTVHWMNKKVRMGVDFGRGSDSSFFVITDQV